MDDDQLLFWLTRGKMAGNQAKPKEPAVKMAYDPKKSFIENLQDFQRRKAEWEAQQNGKDR